MIMLLFGNKIRTDEPSRIFYAAAAELIAFDIPVFWFLLQSIIY